MNVKSVEKEATRASVTVELTREELEPALNRAYLKYRKDIMIPGFRKGHAPRMVIEAAYGKHVFFEDAVEDMFPDIYKDAVLTQDIRPVGRPSVSKMDIADDGAVTLTIVTDLYPVAELGEYKNLEIEKAEVEVKESEVEAGDGQAAAPAKMTGRQKWSLIVFGLTFVIMIVSFIPWTDLGVDIFEAGQVTEEVTTTISGDELITAYDEANGTTTELAAPVEATSVSEETVQPAWSSFLTGVPLGGWYFDEASTWFLLMALVIGLIGGVSEARFVKAFINGAADMMSVVLIIALARSITVLMASTGLDMWILENAANALAGMSAIIFAPLSFLLYIVLSFLIPSSSGMATVSIPIMGGLAHQLNFSVETMVMIYSAGNGLVNLFTPTSGAIMGGLALAKIEWTTWLKFALKLIVVLSVVCAIILTVACVLI